MSTETFIGKMTSLADAIRNKTGLTGVLTIDEMISTINSISIRPVITINTPIGIILKINLKNPLDIPSDRRNRDYNSFLTIIGYKVVNDTDFRILNKYF